MFFVPQQSTVWKAKRSLRRMIASHSFFAPLFYRRHRDYDGALKGLHNDTDLVVDAFPRSANTTFSRSVMVAQAGRMRIAHHLHSPGVIIAAAKRGVPVVTIIRDPADAVVSFAVFQTPHCNNVDTVLAVALDEYIRFHEGIYPYLAGVCVLRFEDAIGSLAASVGAINARLGLDLDTGDDIPEFGDELREVIAESHKALHAEGMQEHKNPEPSENREQLRSAFRERLNSPKVATKLERARQIYSRFLHVAVDV